MPFWILSLSILITPALAADFQEFEVDQDSFRWERLSDDTARLRARFSSAPRISIAPLVVGLPENVTVEWKAVRADGVISRESVRLTEMEIGDLRDWIQESRQWLSDVPLAVFRFGRLDHFPLADRDGGKADFAQVRDVTFELKFSQPFPKDSPPDRTSTHPSDTYHELAKSLVVNPSDISLVRGVSFPPPADEVPAAADLKYLGFASDGARFPSLRVTTVGEEIIAVSGKDALQAGFDIAQFPAERLTLYHKGRPIPICTEALSANRWGAEESIWFLAQPVESYETWENVYFLTWSEGAGDRLQDLGPEYEKKIFPPNHEPRQWDYGEIRLEQNDPTLQVHGEPGFFELAWKRFEPPSDSLETHFDLHGLAAGTNPEEEVTLECRFLQTADPPTESTLSLTINGHAAAPVRILGSTVRIHVPQKVFLPRGNRLTLQTQNVRMAHDLDRIRLSYPCDSLLESAFLSPNILSAESQGEATHTIVQRRVDPAGGKWTTLFLDQGVPVSFFHNVVDPDRSSLLSYSIASQHDWRLFDLEQATPPKSLKLIDSPFLPTEQNQADLLVIAPEFFHASLSPYLSRRSKQGWTVNLRSPQDLYDAFSYGIKDYTAIQAYCRWALQHGPAPKPQFLWLVGEASWDPKHLLGPGTEDLIHCPPFATEGGLSGNDQVYVTVIGQDSLPDLLVSRVSVSTTAELNHYLEKALASENPPELGWWRATSLLLSDYGYRGYHHDHLDWGLIDHTIPQFFSVDDYPLDRTRSFEAVGRAGTEARGIRQEIVSAWSSGATFLEYVGHGGVTVWSTMSLFKGLDRPDSDIRRLTNVGRYPFMLVRSCMSGGVNWPTSPGTVSVAEEAIRAPGRGAVAALGASGATYQDSQDRYARKLHAALWNHGFRRLGLVRGYAHSKHVLQRPDEIPIANQFHLHGDPLLQLSFPYEAQLLGATWEVEEGSPSLKLSWTNSIPGGMGQLRLHSDGEILFESEPFSSDADTGSISSKVPLHVAVDGKLSAALYFWDSATETDAFAGGRIPPYSPPKTGTIGLVPVTQEPPIEVGLVVSSPPLVRGAKEGFLLRLTPRPGSRKSLKFNTTVILEETVRLSKTLTIPADAVTHEAFEVPFAEPGTVPIQVELEATDPEGKSVAHRFEGSLEVDEPGELHLSRLSLNPIDPVSGEMLSVSLTFSNVGSNPLEAIEGKCEILLADGSRIPAFPFERDRERFPLSLIPDETTEITWAVLQEIPVGIHQFEIALNSPSVSTVRVVPFQVTRPPQLEIVSIEPASSDPGPVPGENPLAFRIEYKNTGDAPSDPLVLVASDRISGETLSSTLASLPALGIGSATALLASARGDFHWETRLLLTPTAITSRTQWKPQRLESHLVRSWDLAGDLDDGEWTATFDSQSDQRPLSYRLLEATPLGFNVSKDAKARELFAGDLDILEPSLARSVVDPFYAASLFHSGWWVGASEIHAPQKWEAPAFPLRIPWDHSPVLAQIAPLYRKVGADMPYFNLKGEGLHLSVTSENSSYEGVHREKPVVEIARPGYPVTLVQVPGRSTGFRGFEFVPLPVATTPILELPDAGPWSASSSLEIPSVADTRIAHSEFRRFEEGKGWTAWRPTESANSVEAKRIQLRTWIDPTITNQPLYVRSFAFSVRRASL